MAKKQAKKKAAAKKGGRKPAVSAKAFNRSLRKAAGMTGSSNG